MTEPGLLEPRTHSGRKLLHDMGLTAKVRSLYHKERRQRLIRSILDIEYEAATPSDAEGELEREMAYSHGYGDGKRDAATPSDGGLREAARRVLDEYDEDNRRAPSFVTIELIRLALGSATPKDET